MNPLFRYACRCSEKGPVLDAFFTDEEPRGRLA